MIQLLLVDDDPIVNLINERMVKKYDPDIKIFTYRSSRRALETIKDKTPEKNMRVVVFLDLNMPEINGWEFLQEIESAKLNYTPEIFILTSSIDPREIALAEDHKLIKSFITKPLSKSSIEYIFESSTA